MVGGQLRNVLNPNSNTLALNDKYSYGLADESVDFSVAPGGDLSSGAQPIVPETNSLMLAIASAILCAEG